MSERTVRFYEILNGKKERFPNKIPHDELRDAIDELDDSQAYVSLASMEVLGSTYVPKSTGARRGVPLIILDRITRDVRLRIERRRNYRPFVLGEDETLAEPTFYAVLDDNVLAVMRNSGSSPGPSSFRDYLNNLELISGGVHLTPLVDRNALRALAKVGTLTKFNIAVGPDVSADVFGKSSVLTGLIRQFRQGLGHVGIELSVKIAPKGQEAESEIAFRDIESLARSEAIGYVEKAFIGYRRLEDGKADSFDLLNEAVAQTVEIELDSESEQPTNLSVAQGIADAYDELYDEIRSALRETS